MYKQPLNVSLVVNFIMATLILFMGAVLMFTDLYTDVIQAPKRTWLAVIFFAYAGFRYMRGWQLYKKNQRDKQREEWDKQRRSRH
jgi:hypothetical protein